jgi:prephenate dehydratase
MTSVSFQGVAGAYSEQAIRQYFGAEVETVPCRTFEDLFIAVEQGKADYGMLPVENSLAGSVVQSYELLMEHDLRVRAEIIVRIEHQLLIVPGTDPDSLTCAKSHPQALAQCERYLIRRGLNAIPTFDTAGSARDLAQNPVEGTAAIASELAAELYGLEILDSGIEDLPFNYTRFFILGLDDPPRAQRSKTSLIFTTRHNPGALYDSLGEFAQRGINLSKIESRPRRNRPWQYLFYLDFDGHWQDPPCEAALMGLLRRSSFVKLLGSYPAATTPFEEVNGSL